MTKTRMQAPLARRDKVEGWAFAFVYVAVLPGLMMLTTWASRTLHAAISLIFSDGGKIMTDFAMLHPGSSTARGRARGRAFDEPVRPTVNS